MFELVKDAIRAYVHWVGLVYGFAVAPGFLLATFGVAPAHTPLLLFPVAALLLIGLDPPAQWRLPVWQSLLTRFSGVGAATIMVVAFSAFSDRFGSQNWGETLLALGLADLVYAILAVWRRASGANRFSERFSRGRLALRTFAMWVGVFFGVFYIPATGLAAAGSLLMVFPLYGVFITGFVLLWADPPARWAPHGSTELWTRIVASGTAALLLLLHDSVWRHTDTGEIYFGDWVENIIVCGGAWALYAVTAGVAYLGHNSSRSAS